MKKCCGNKIRDVTIIVFCKTFMENSRFFIVKVYINVLNSGNIFCALSFDRKWQKKSCPFGADKK